MWFVSLSDAGSGQVKMANDTMSTVKGIGSVRLRNEDGSTVLLTKVRYVPRVRALLIGEV